MKFLAFALGIAVCALTASAGSAGAEEAKQDFKLVNKTGYELKELYVSPSKSDDWQDDVLGQGTLGDGDGANIKFHRATKACHWDLKVVYSVDSSSAVWSDIDLCSVEKITIRYDKDADKTTANFD
ncbi:MAG: hypothetical protein ABR970_02515 [Roseiarcus sp.]|jgi:hypothetical protein